MQIGQEAGQHDPLGAQNVDEGRDAGGQVRGRGSHRVGGVCVAADQKLDLAPLAYLDALEIRLDERTPLRIVRGRRVSFGVLADDRIASVYVKCSESERELFLEASNP